MVGFEAAKVESELQLMVDFNQRKSKVNRHELGP
jgi:hypothetical protein